MTKKEKLEFEINKTLLILKELTNDWTKPLIAINDHNPSAITASKPKRYVCQLLRKKNLAVMRQHNLGGKWQTRQLWTFNFADYDQWDFFTGNKPTDLIDFVKKEITASGAKIDFEK